MSILFVQSGVPGCCCSEAELLFGRFFVLQTCMILPLEIKARWMQQVPGHTSVVGRLEIQHQVVTCNQQSPGRQEMLPAEVPSPVLGFPDFVLPTGHQCTNPAQPEHSASPTTGQRLIFNLCPHGQDSLGNSCPSCGCGFPCLAHTVTWGSEAGTAPAQRGLMFTWGLKSELHWYFNHLVNV